MGAEFEAVDDEVGFFGGDFEEAEVALVAAEAVVVGVEGEDVLVFEVVDEELEVFELFDEVEVCGDGEADVVDLLGKDLC